MATMTFAQAIRDAVKAERAAERFYIDLASRTEDPRAREFLNEIAKQEDEHARSIEKLGADEITGDLSAGADWNVETIETAPEWASQPNLTLEQALAIALENEQHAELYYGALADSAQGRTADFLREIARAEGLHYQRLLKVQQEGF
jgi:rubrerythrin